MFFETFNSSLKSKIFEKNIFDEEFLKEKDDALQPIKFSFELINEIEIKSRKPKIETKPEKPISKTKIRNSFKDISNIVIIESSPEYISESTFSAKIQKEIEKIEEQNIIQA